MNDHNKTHAPTPGDPTSHEDAAHDPNGPPSPSAGGEPAFPEEVLDQLFGGGAAAGAGGSLLGSMLDGSMLDTESFAIGAAVGDAFMKASPDYHDEAIHILKQACDAVGVDIGEVPPADRMRLYLSSRRQAKAETGSLGAQIRKVASLLGDLSGELPGVPEVQPDLASIFAGGGAASKETLKDLLSDHDRVRGGTPGGDGGV